MGGRGAAVDTVVVGAGMGGLSAALRLAGAGVRVVVVDRGAEVGGKMRVVRVGDQEIDAGPTVLTMRHVFEALWAEAGLDFHAAVPTTRLEVLARHAWTDGRQLDLFADVDRSAEAIAAFAGKRESDAFVRFHRQATTIHDAVRGPFIEAPTPSLLANLAGASPRTLWRLMKIDWHRSLWRMLGSYFRDPKLRQLFARYATYYGSNPFAAPGTLSLISAVEQAGVWRVDGGMIGLARATAAAIEQLGGTIVCGAEVDRIETDAEGVCAVRCADGRRFPCRSVIHNGTTAALGGLLGHGPETPAAPPPSLSAVTFCGLGQAKGFDLQWHNVFFSDDYQTEFEDIFGRGRIPAHPTTYICAQDRGSLSEAREHERLFCLINAPARGDTEDFDAQIDALKAAMTTQLERCGLSLSLERCEVSTPTTFARRFPASRGALYGPATHGALGAFGRPGAATEIPGLFQVGGDIHPGAGVPMVALGGRIAADQTLETLGLHRTSPFSTGSVAECTP